MTANTSSWKGIVKFLELLPPSVQEVSIRHEARYYPTCPTHCEPFTTNGMTLVDPVLAQERLKCLRRVLFVVKVKDIYYRDDDPPQPAQPSLTREQIKDAVHAQLPKLHKRGITEVQLEHQVIHVLQDRPDKGKLASLRISRYPRTALHEMALTLLLALPTTEGAEQTTT